MAGFLQGLWFPLCQNQPSYCVADSLPIRKSKFISASVEKGFFRRITWRYCLCFTPSQNGKVWPLVHGENMNFILLLNHHAERRGEEKNQTSWCRPGDCAFSESSLGSNNALWVFAWDLKARKFWRRKHSLFGCNEVPLELSLLGNAGELVPSFKVPGGYKIFRLSFLSQHYSDSNTVGQVSSIFYCAYFLDEESWQVNWDLK